MYYNHGIVLIYYQQLSNLAEKLKNNTMRFFHKIKPLIQMYTVDSCQIWLKTQEFKTSACKQKGSRVSTR